MAYIDKKTVRLFENVLVRNQNFVLVTHTNPDGDAMGSMLGLYFYLKSIGKNVVPIAPTPYAEFLHWLPGNSEVLKFRKDKRQIKTVISEAGVVIFLDLNDPERTGGLWQYLEQNTDAVKVLIDHHPDPVHFCDLVISDTRPAATAELIFDLIQSMDAPQLKEKALCVCLYTGIMTDTGCFSFNSSRPETFRTVANILESGIDKDRIFNRIYNTFSDSRMRLLGFSLDQKMKVLPSHRTAYIALTAEEMKRYHFQFGDSEGFVNHPLSINGIRFSALFLEKKKHIKISFRSRGSFPANEFSEKHFNGGGHLNAAGGESSVSMEETLKKFESLLSEYHAQLCSDD